MRVKPYLVPVIVLILYANVSGCMVHIPSVVIEVITIPLEELNFPNREYDLITWLPHQGLVAFSTDSFKPTNRQVEYAYEGGNALKSIPFEEDSSCHQFTRYYLKRVLPDGRLGVIKHCAGKVQDDLGPGIKYLMAYDWETQKTEQIVSGDLPHILSNDFSWNPEMTRGVQEIYDVLDGTLYWISPSGTEPMELTLSDGRNSWLLSRVYSDFKDSKDFGIAHSPAWSPDGKVIAFWASLDAVGKEDLSREDSRYELIFLNPMEMTYTRILSNVYHPQSLEWSGNSHLLAFTGEIKGFPEKGIWLYFLENQKLFRIATGHFFSPVWSPDGKSLAVIRCNDKLCKDTKIIKLDLTQLLVINN